VDAGEDALRSAAAIIPRCTEIARKKIHNLSARTTSLMERCHISAKAIFRNSLASFGCWRNGIGKQTVNLGDSQGYGRVADYVSLSCLSVNGWVPRFPWSSSLDC
jgi:hypothetical protein